MFPFDVAPSEVERYAGEGGAHFESAKTCGCRGCFADLENSAADSTPRPARMYEKSAYLRRIVAGIEESIFATGAVVASIERLALAPASAAGYDLVLIHRGFGYKVGAILDQLSVHAKDAFERLFQLFRRVVSGLQAQDGGAYEMLQRRNIGENGLSNREEHELLC